jgi:hypothetical protein
VLVSSPVTWIVMNGEVDEGFLLDRSLKALVFFIEDGR